MTPTEQVHDSCSATSQVIAAGFEASPQSLKERTKFAGGEIRC